MIDSEYLSYLIRLRLQFERLAEKNISHKGNAKVCQSIGLTEAEIRGWIGHEPDFTRKRPPDKLPVYPPGGG